MKDEQTKGENAEEKAKIRRRIRKNNKLSLKAVFVFFAYCFLMFRMADNRQTFFTDWNTFIDGFKIKNRSQKKPAQELKK